MNENLETVLNMLQPEIRNTLVKLMRLDPVICTSFRVSEELNADPITLLSRAVIDLYSCKEKLKEEYEKHLARCPGQPKLLTRW